MTTNNTHSKSEIGHIKNLENFAELIEICNRYGADYAPTATALEIPNLQASLAEFRLVQDQVNEAFANLTGKINARQYEFEKIRPLTSRILKALAVATDDDKIVADARKFANKIQGRPPKIKTNDNQDGQETAVPRSNSQQSYDKLQEHFENLILLLKTVPEYAPNENDLTIVNLENYLEGLRNLSHQHTLAMVPYQKALTDRDNLLYHDKIGVVALAKKVKMYVSSIYGAKSLEYKEINKLPFRTIKRR